MTHITRTQMIQIQSHYADGKTIEELATMVGDTQKRVIALLGDLYEVGEDSEPANTTITATASATAKEENWGE